jgi:integrin alpha FG-GAP repeat containing protein 1
MVNSNNGAMKSCAGQMSQSADFALQMPYTIFGLGLYANYIEKLIARVPSGYSTISMKRTVEQIVPDSQIVFIPNPMYDPQSWKVQLFLTPSEIIYKTLYTLSGICIVLVFIIGVLHRKEMLEDVKEQAEFKKQWPEIRR